MSRHQAIESQALDWLIRSEEPGWTADDQVQLDIWLAEAIAHKSAFWRAQFGWRQADRIGSLGLAESEATFSRPLPVRWWPLLAAASLVAAISLGSFALKPEEVEHARYETPVGGRRIVPLVDGSRIELNTATTVRTAIADDGREIWLDSGEAFFEVAHRSGQPFVVHAGKQTVTVLGTKFSVRRDQDRVSVNVLEGRVRVDNGSESGSRAAIIAAGDFAVTRGASTLIASRSPQRVAGALAWREGMLNFDQASLSEVVAEFNRYNRRPIRVGDSETGRITIGGTFRASNVEAFVRLLRDAYGLKVEETAEQIKISR